MSSRQEILKTLREVSFPSPEKNFLSEYQPVTPMPGASREAILARFVQEAVALGVHIYRPDHPSEAIRIVLEVIESEKKIMAWDFSHIPLPGLSEELEKERIKVMEELDPSIKVGITGADVALASTGTIILFNGGGKLSRVSLLPQKHIAIFHEDQILPDFETWVQGLAADNLDVFRKTSSITAISGPSRTADIAMEQIIGMHGPGELYIVLVQ